MRFSALSSMRSLAMALGAIFIAAIALGRMSGPAPHLRGVEPVRFVAVPSRIVADSDSPTEFLDLESGAVSRLGLSGDDALESPALSPWRDESGQGQVAGRWLNHSGQGESRVTTEFGLARYTFPGGEPLNRVASDILPEGSPCWYPGTGAKILFAAGDGALYRFAFEGSKAPDAGPEGCDPRPIPIVWKVAPPGSDERSVRIADPIWPEGRGFGGRVIVSLRIEVREDGKHTLSPPRLWSLKLDHEGKAIEAAAPLAPDDTEVSADFAGVKERFPRAARTAAGIEQIAFLARKPGRDVWDLRSARILLDAEGAPRFASSPELLAERLCGFAAPAFSSDGRWVYFLPGNPREAGIHRVPATTDRALASSPLPGRQL